MLPAGQPAGPTFRASLALQEAKHSCSKADGTGVSQGTVYVYTNVYTHAHTHTEKRILGGQFGEV